MPFRLKNADVLFISIVPAGANKREVFFKAGVGVNTPVFEREFVVRKADDARQIIYGVVYPVGSPTDTDTQGDFATAEDVTAMAQAFMAKGRTAFGVDRDHNYRSLEKVYVAESWIVRKGDPIFGSANDEGAWAVGIKVEDPALYAELKAANYRGFSMAGTAERIEVAKSDEEKSKDNNVGWLAKFRQRLLGKEETMDELKKALEALATQVAALTAKVDGGGKTEPSKPEVPPADLSKQLADLTATVKALGDKVTAAEKTETAKPAEGETKTETPDLAKTLTEMVATVKGLTERVDGVEKLRQGSAQPDPNTVKKSTALGVM